MFSRYWLTTLRVCALLAVLASAALFVHYLAPTASGFCGPRSGCEAVRTSSLGSAGTEYFNLPVIGVIAYAALFGLSFVPSQRSLLRTGAAIGAFLAIALIFHQALAVGSFCWLCLSVDAMAIGVGYAAASLPGAETPSAQPLALWAWLTLLLIALASPLGWVLVKPRASLPKALAELTSDEPLTVLEFGDFQCPHCRRLHPTLKAALAAVERSVVVKRFHVPLPFHPLAEGAARAALCAGEQGKEAEMSDLLFEEPLAADVWFAHAKRLGLDEAAFRACLPKDAITQTLSDHVDLFNAGRLRGLPSTVIGHQLLKGAPPPEQVVKAVAAALRPQRFSLSGLPYWGGVLVLTGATLGLGRRRGGAAGRDNSPRP